MLEVHTLFVPYLQVETPAQVVVHATPVTEQVPPTATQGTVAEQVAPVAVQVPGVCGQSLVVAQMVLSFRQ